MQSYRVDALINGADQQVVYDVSRDPSRAIDIVSQVERALAWIGRAVTEHPTEKPRLLTIGGGLAGSAAGLLAAENGFTVRVVDARSSRAGLLGMIAASPRHVSPTLYRWPDADWLAGRESDQLPAVHAEGVTTSLTRSLMGWRDGPAFEMFGTMAKGITDVFTERAAGTLSVTHELHLSRPSDEEPCLVLEDANGPAYARGRPELDGEQWDYALVCVGPGPERVWIPDEDRPSPGTFRGAHFWAADDKAVLCLSPRAEAPHPLTDGARVVIVGGGDGALQDLAQLATGLHVTALAAALHRDGAWFSELSRHAAERFSAAGLDRRSRRDPKNAGPVLEDLVRGRYAADVTRVMDELVAFPRDRRALERLTLFQPGARVGRDCFPMNRLLGLMLQEWSSRRLQKPLIVLDAKATAVTSDEEGHVCGDPRGCWGRRHTVTVLRGGILEVSAAEHVIVRLGLAERDRWWWEAPVWRTQQGKAGGPA